MDTTNYINKNKTYVYADNTIVFGFIKFYKKRWYYIEYYKKVDKIDTCLIQYKEAVKMTKNTVTLTEEELNEKICIIELLK